MITGETDETDSRMLTSLKSKDKDERLIAAMGLCTTRKTQFIEPIIKIMDKITWDEVDDLSSSLCLFGKPLVPYLISVLPIGKKSTIACAMRTLGRIRGDEAAEALVEQLISLPTKSEPTEALVSMREEAVPFLVPLIKHSKADVREMAAFALGKIGDKNSLTLLENMAEADKSEKVREVSNRAASWVRGETICAIDLRHTFGVIELGQH